MGSLGKIVSIETVYDLKFPSVSTYEMFDGYKVSTNEHEITVLIENGQSCCENWGYFETQDNTDCFVGAELFEVKLTDTAIDEKIVLNRMEEDYYTSVSAAVQYGGIQFVDFKTDKGTFQIAVYNAHNGFYGHDIVVAIDKEILCNDTL